MNCKGGLWVDTAISEINQLWRRINQQEVRDLIDLLGNSKEKLIVGLGAGRMGYSVQAFIMRLAHLGYHAFMIGDTSLPRVNNNSIIIVNSSSGETPSICLFVEQCKAAGCFVVALTTNHKSFIGQNADFVVQIPKLETQQLMKTIYEQFTFVFYDFIVYELASKNNDDLYSIESNHSVLE